MLRSGDDSSYQAAGTFESRLPIRIAPVSRPGLIAALNTGLAAATSEIVAMTDDDVVPRSDWLQRIEGWFESDPQIAGVGGRDYVWKAGKLVTAERRIGDQRITTVGKVQSLGRIVGRHHLGRGEARDVDVIKGANMSFRRQLLLPHGFDERLRGTGSQPHNELSVCLPLKKAGWRLIYDPDVAVDHYPRERQGGDVRERHTPEVVRANAFNETISLLAYLDAPRRFGFLLYSVIIGSRTGPGLLQVPRLLVAGESRATRLMTATWRGRLDAWRAHRSQPRPKLGAD